MNNGKRVITLINQINSHIQSMGMLLKPSKCRAFSIQSEKPSIVQFYIGDIFIPFIAQEEQTFLGKDIFFSSKSKEYQQSRIKLVIVKAHVGRGGARRIIQRRDL